MQLHVHGPLPSGYFVRNQTRHTHGDDVSLRHYNRALDIFYASSWYIAPTPEDIPRLAHAGIVCNYKEPLEVLRATIESPADNILASSTIVVLACEDRDVEVDATFTELEAQFSGCF